LIPSLAPVAAQELLVIRVTSGGNMTVAAGRPSSRPIVVEVVDATRQGVANATVTFQLPSEGPTGRFASGLKSESVLTDDRGEARVFGLVWGALAGPLHVRVKATARDLTGETEIPMEITGAPPASSSRGLGDGRGLSSARKWIVIAAVAGGAAAGLAFAGSKKSSATAAASTPALAPPSLGQPVIVVGRP
jgi:hypothetical protein